MSFALNTTSGYLHDPEVEDAGANAQDFERADEADLWAHANGLKMVMCSRCFPGASSAITVEAPEITPEAQQAQLVADRTADAEDDE